MDNRRTSEGDARVTGVLGRVPDEARADERVYDPPVEADVSCHRCVRPIAATARIKQVLEIHGCYQYRWVHVDTGASECRLPPKYAEPYDWWHATQRVEAALAGRYAVEKALDDAVDLVGGESS